MSFGLATEGAGYHLITMTPRRQSVLDFVLSYQRKNGVPPSSRDVARRFGISQPGATKHLQALASGNHLSKMADGKWGLRPAALETGRALPIFGSIPAGQPTDEEQRPESTLNVDPAIFGVDARRSSSLWFLRVAGDSMIGASIRDGDLVALVRKDPMPGEIIAALVDETTTTLKRLVRRDGRFILRAENPAYPDIVADRIESQGVVVGLIRRIAHPVA